MWSEIVDIGVDDVKTGMQVEIACRKGWEDAEGNDVIMYKFKPRQ